MLMVTTTVRMVHRIHGNATSTRPTARQYISIEKIYQAKIKNKRTCNA